MYINSQKLFNAKTNTIIPKSEHVCKFYWFLSRLFCGIPKISTQPYAIYIFFVFAFGCRKHKLQMETYVATVHFLTLG